MASATEIIPAAHARSAWAAGVAPLYRAFPHIAGSAIRAAVFAHLARFPVPVFITGDSGSGRTVLARAIAEIAGDLEPLTLAEPTVEDIRNSAIADVPLVLDDVAVVVEDVTTDDLATTPSLFDAIGGEAHGTANTRLHDPSILVVTGNQPISEVVKDRVLHLPLTPPGHDVDAMREAAGEPATAARRFLHSYLQQSVPVRTPDDDDGFGVRMASSHYLDHEHRRDAALCVGDQLLRTLRLEAGEGAPTSWLEPDYRLLWALRRALRYTLAHGGILATTPHSREDWIVGRRDETHTYLRPAELLRFLRVELDDSTLTTNAVTRALARMRILATNPAQGGTVPVKLNGSLFRGWRISNELLD